MSACDGCKRRTPRCHADCADYMAERILRDDAAIRAERDYRDYQETAIYNGGRRKSGKRAYKGWRTPGWHIRGGKNQ